MLDTQISAIFPCCTATTFPSKSEPASSSPAGVTAGFSLFTTMTSVEFTYSLEKSIASSRSGLIDTPAATKSTFPLCTAASAPSKSIFLISSSLPISSAIAFAMSISIPTTSLPFIYSYGANPASVPTISFSDFAPSSFPPHAAMEIIIVPANKIPATFFIFITLPPLVFCMFIRLYCILYYVFYKNQVVFANLCIFYANTVK